MSEGVERISLEELKNVTLRRGFVLSETEVGEIHEALGRLASLLALLRRNDRLPEAEVLPIYSPAGGGS